MKKCNKCSEEKNLLDFDSDRTKKDGKSTVCRTCRAVSNLEWRKKNNTLDKSNISVGFDGIIGLDYKIKHTPLNLSIDWQPSFSIIQGYFKNQGGIGIRYTIK